MRELVLIVLLLFAVQTVQAQDVIRASDKSQGNLHYPINEAATIYASPDRSQKIGEAPMRRSLYVTDEIGGWYKVTTDRGDEGFVRRADVSNYWVRVSKKTHSVYLYKGDELQRRISADFGYNAFADKDRRGSDLLRDHWRTPEGSFYVVNRNPNSMYYKAFVLNYPRPSDAQRGLESGLISESQYEQINYADRVSQMPPMSTSLGGWIEIHGGGTNSASNWTRGCVAVTNDEMDELWRYVRVGTPVLIE